MGERRKKVRGKERRRWGKTNKRGERELVWRENTKLGTK